MKYKYLRLRLIIPSLIVIMLIVLVLLFFTGGLKAASIDYDDNIEWTEDGFISPEAIVENGKTKWLVNGEAINTKKYVTDTDKYVMYINEDTTIVSIYEKLTGWTKGDTTKEKLMYVSANINGASNDEKSNITLYPIDENGKILNALTSYDKSVMYSNTLAGTNEKHYSLRYNADGSIDILYQIGDFSNLLETFPKYFDRSDFEEIFIGNTFFKYNSDSEVKKTKVNVYDEEGNFVSEGYQIDVASKFNSDIKDDAYAYGFGYCFDNEAALYILKNGLGTIKYTADNKNFGVVDATYTEVPEDENEILNKEKGYWQIFNFVDEEGNLKFKYGENCNCAGSPIKINPFLTASIISNTLFSEGYYPITYEYTDTQGNTQKATTTVNDRVNMDNSKLEFKANQTLTSKSLYEYLCVGQYGLYDTEQKLYNYLISDETKADKIKIYEKHAMTLSDEKNNDIVVYYDYNGDGVITSDEAFIYGGYQARDLQGNYLFIDSENKVFYFDENGNRMINDDEGVAHAVDSNSEYRAYQNGLTKEITEEQNTKFDALSEASSSAYQIALRFMITDGGLDITVINEAIIEGLGSDAENVASYFKHDKKLYKVEICKYITANNDATAEGEIILPDGSGAIISFNSQKDKQSVSKYAEKFIYGGDSAINQETMGYESETLMFPMFGFLEQSRNYGIVAIIDKGAAQSSITANFRRESAISGIEMYNYAYFSTYYRSTEDVKITSSSSYVKVSEKLYESDVVYKYQFIKPDENNRLDYTTVAKCYREYLINKYNLESKKDETTVATPTFTFVGAYKKKTILLGVVYEAERSLTTFEEAETIIDDLTNNGISSMNVDYTLWTDDEGQDPITYKVDVSSVLGGKNDLINLYRKVKEKGYSMFLDFDVTYGMGYDMPFGSLKYNTKSISGSQTSVLQYVLSTGLADSSRGAGGNLSPVFYNSLLTKYMKNYSKLEIDGIALYGIGDSKNSDYSRNRQVYSGDDTKYQRNALETVKATGKKIMLSSPFDYAFEYVDVASSVPVKTTLLPIIDYSIPLYQLVCSGLFDYTSPTINYNNDNSIEWNILKAIETGSNLLFEVSSSDTSELLDTYYTSYYNSYYANWKEKIIYMNKVLNNSGIYKSRLVDHEIINDNLVRVRYENGLTIIINYSNSNYVDAASGIAVRANWYAIEELGKEE